MRVWWAVSAALRAGERGPRRRGRRVAGVVAPVSPGKVLFLQCTLNVIVISKMTHTRGEGKEEVGKKAPCLQ